MNFKIRRKNNPIGKTHPGEIRRNGTRTEWCHRRDGAPRVPSVLAARQRPEAPVWHVHTPHPFLTSCHPLPLLSLTPGGQMVPPPRFQLEAPHYWPAEGTGACTVPASLPQPPVVKVGLGLRVPSKTIRTSYTFPISPSHVFPILLLLVGLIFLLEHLHPPSILVTGFIPISFLFNPDRSCQVLRICSQSLDPPPPNLSPHTHT